MTSPTFYLKYMTKKETAKFDDAVGNPYNHSWEELMEILSRFTAKAEQRWNKKYKTEKK